MCLDSILFAFYTFATVLVILGNETDNFADKMPNTDWKGGSWYIEAAMIFHPFIISISSVALRSRERVNVYALLLWTNLLIALVSLITMYIIKGDRFMHVYTDFKL